ncbi:histidine phosphatase family protein [Vibrio parahaemolyticus]|nr:histidine phosphatase family protein [Vibrio parahaemolyticus]
MQCIYVRHGRTKFSIENRFAGRRDIPIVGIDDKKLTEAFSLTSEHNPLTLLHSPLKRAVQTAQYFIDNFSFEEIISEPLLIERDFGVFEGKVKSEENRRKLEFGIGVESLEQLDSRVNKFLIKYQHRSDNILIVGHSAFYRRLSRTLGIQNKLELSCCEANCFEVHSKTILAP